MDFNLALTYEVFAAVATACGFAALCYGVGRSRGSSADKSKIKTLVEDNERLTGEVGYYTTRFDNLEKTVGDAQDFWSKPPPATFDIAKHQDQLSQSIPIITVVNFKGGVGKTTICANLGAHFAAKGKRVLLIDFDYQGSLTDTVMSHADVNRYTFSAQMLLEAGHPPGELRGLAERVSKISPNLWIYPAFYGFSRAEIQQMFRWLVGKDDEIRFNLHNYLQSQAVQSNTETKFDLVLIDAPPRLLTGVVNALAASTHVLVPTILDGQSHLATLNTLGAIQIFRQRLNRGLKTLAVVPSQVTNSTGYNEREQKAISELERNIPEFHLDGPLPILTERPIVRKEELAKAGGSEVHYLTEARDKKSMEIREMFARLGDYIEARLRWNAPSQEQTVAFPGRYTNENRTVALGS